MSDRNLVKKVMTFKSGKFAFSRKCRTFGTEKLSDLQHTAYIYHEMIADFPILPNSASRMDEELIMRSIFGTAAIEGNPLREEDVANILSDPKAAASAEKAEREILNLKAAYDYATREITSAPDFELTEDVIKEIHAIITGGIEGSAGIPGRYRNELVKVDNAEHGGIYTPTKILDDIKNLMKEFVDWINSEEVVATGPFARAGLAHYHLALIHPFFDGNGRTARLIEGMLLGSADIKFLPLMLSSYYYRNMDDYYWAFSKSIKSKEYDVSPFLEFFYTGVVESLEEIKQKISHIIRELVLRQYYADLRKDKELSQRQHDFMISLLEYPQVVRLSLLFEKTPFSLLYKSVSQRTALRDLQKLKIMGLLTADGKDYSLNFRVLG